MPDSDAPAQVRVHGVAGTTPDVLLRTAPAGPFDREGRPLRRRAGKVAVERFHAHDPVPEGFSKLIAVSWSALTSGLILHATNILLSPLLLTNAAGWMAPPRKPCPAQVGLVLHRTIALASTAILSTGLAWSIIVVPSTACSLLVTATDELITLLPVVEEGATQPDGELVCSWVPNGIPLALAALIGLFMVLTPMMIFCRRVPRPPGNLWDHPAAPVDPWDWPGRIRRAETSPSTYWLRWLHIGMALAVCTVTVGISAQLSGVIRVGVGFVAGLFMLVGPLPAPAAETRKQHVFARSGAAIAVGGSVVVTALLLGGLLVGADTATDVMYSHINAVLLVVVPAAVSLILSLGLVCIDEHWRSGLAAVSVAAFSLMVAGLFAAGSTLVVVNRLGLSSFRRTLGDNTPLTVAFTATLLILLVLVAASLMRQLPQDEAARGSLARAAAAALRRGPRRLPCALLLAQALGWACGVLAIPNVASFDGELLTTAALVVLVGAAAVMTALLTMRSATRIRTRMAGLAVAGAAPAIFADRAFADLAGTLDLVALSVPIALVGGLVLGAVRRRNSRRGGAVLLDAMGFWPRSYHPLIPLPYAAEAVESLREEVAGHTDTGVVLCGHSQGAVLSLAAVAGLPTEIGRRVGLVLYGSPVAGLYQQLFPTHFDDSWVEQTITVVDGRVRNLLRDTDPIAAPTGHDCVDVYLTDDPENPRVHSGYEAEAEFIRAALRVRPGDQQPLFPW